MLTKCTECDQDVSDSAEVCPHCGYRLLGRENLVRCKRCGVEVIPEANPHNVMIRCCPLCHKPVTGRLASRLLTIFVLVVAAIIAFVVVRAVFKIGLPLWVAP